MRTDTKTVLLGFAISVVSAMFFYGIDDINITQKIGTFGLIFVFWLMGIATGFGHNRNGIKTTDNQ